MARLPFEGLLMPPERFEDGREMLLHHAEVVVEFLAPRVLLLERVTQAGHAVHALVRAFRRCGGWPPRLQRLRAFFPPLGFSAGPPCFPPSFLRNPFFHFPPVRGWCA